MSGIRAVVRVLLLGTLLVACSSGRAGDATRTAGAPALGDTIIQANLSVPWDIAFAPDGRMFMTERMGNIVMFESAKPNAKPGCARPFVPHKGRVSSASRSFAARGTHHPHHGPVQSDRAVAA